MNSIIDRLLGLPLFSRGLSQYQALEQRDQLALKGLVVALSGILLVYGLWMPLSDYAVNSAALAENRLKLLSWMQSTEADARAVSGVKPEKRRSGQSLLTVVSKTSQATGVKPAKLQPEGNDEVSVWFENTDFNQVLHWLDKLRLEGIHIKQLSIDRQETEGRISARIVLRT